MPDETPNLKANEVAAELAMRLDEADVDYAFGGAIALAFAGEPRATIDVDITLFVDPPEPVACVNVLHQIGCAFRRPAALESLGEHGYCRVDFAGMPLDVFLPTIPFLAEARHRRIRVRLSGQPCSVYDPASLVVLKMMFYRKKDLADVQQILRVQGPALDRVWVREQLVSIFGRHDPRITAWDDLDGDVPVE